MGCSVVVAEHPFLILKTMADEIIKYGKVGGLITYKVGDNVYFRALQAHVHNPRTEAQTEQRAKIKLCSQLSAIFRHFIAIFPSSGKSSRALFQRYLFQNIDFNEGQAEKSLRTIDLSHTITNLPSINFEHDDYRGMNVIKFFLISEPRQEIKRVFYFLFKVLDNRKLMFVNAYLTDTRSTPGIDGYFVWFCTDVRLTDEEVTDAEYFIYAYGMCDLSEQATRRWGKNTFEPIYYVADQIKEGVITPDLYKFTLTKSRLVYKGF